MPSSDHESVAAGAHDAADAADAADDAGLDSAPRMLPIAGFPAAQRAAVRFVLTDIDDTLTRDGRLPACAYSALEALHQAGLKVVPITGRPAGWCDHIARMWPVDAVVGENGAFYFRYDNTEHRMVRRYWKPAAERAADRRRLDALSAVITAAVPGSAVATDQAYREADLAIDFCEDVPALPPAAAVAIARQFERAGAEAKISSIHVNGWFGDYDKLAMTRLLFSEAFGEDLQQVRDQVVYSGDSPNDEPMFAYFRHGVGVANVREFADLMQHPPCWVTESEGGRGFAELATLLLDV